MIKFTCNIQMINVLKMIYFFKYIKQNSVVFVDYLSIIVYSMKITNGLSLLERSSCIPTIKRIHMHMFNHSGSHMGDHIF